MLAENNKILQQARLMHRAQVKWRRHIHQYPELSNEEYKTSSLIKTELKKNKIKLLPLTMKTGVAGIIRGKGKKTVAIRSDIDALAITEKNDTSFKSKNPGIMHACGHDAHVAILLGVAAILNRHRDELGGNVKLFFQPAEEQPPGGAERMIKDGVLKNPKVDMIFGLHVDTSIPTGKFGLRNGPTMASVTDFDITVVGRNAHAARPHESVDAIATASELIGSIQKVVSREVDPLQPAVITFGTINGGTARNIIADKVVLRGTARTLSPVTRRKLPKLIKRTADNVCRARGARAEVDFLANYPVLSNHQSVNEIISVSCEELFGKNRIVETPQVMGGEDFAFFANEIPGAQIRIGTRNRRKGADRPWHSADFMVDEESIFYGTALLVRSVMKFFEM
jgi:amidohydrolase